MSSKLVKLNVERPLLSISNKRLGQSVTSYRVLSKLNVEGDGGAAFALVAVEVTDALGSLVKVSLAVNFDLNVQDAFGGMRNVPTDGINLDVDNTSGTPVPVILVAA